MIIFITIKFLFGQRNFTKKKLQSKSLLTKKYIYGSHGFPFRFNYFDFTGCYPATFYLDLI